MSDYALSPEDIERLKYLAENTLDGSWEAGPVRYAYNAEFTRTCTPKTVLALIEKIESLSQADDKPKCLSCGGSGNFEDCDASIRSMPAKIKHLQQQIASFEEAMRSVYFYGSSDGNAEHDALKKQIMLLNREANWLADKLKGQCECGRYCPADINNFMPCPASGKSCYLSREDWRNAARKFCGGDDE